VRESACRRQVRRGAELGLATDTVRKWRERFVSSGVAGLADGARPGRPKAGLELTAAKRDQLTRWARWGKTSQVLALRAKIVLACAGGWDKRRAAAELRTTEHTVARWRGQFVRQRLVGQTDEPRPGRVPLILLDKSRGGSYRHPRGAAPERHPLVTGLNSQAQRPVEVHGRPGPAQVRRQAAPHRWLPAVHGPAVRGEGRRRRRHVPQPSEKAVLLVIGELHRHQEFLRFLKENRQETSRQAWTCTWSATTTARTRPW
jgi:transposase